MSTRPRARPGGRRKPPLGAGGDRDTAEALVREAHGFAASLGARPFGMVPNGCTHASASPAMASVRLPASRLVKLELTRGEVEVLALLADEMISRTIAAELFMSAKTGSDHVSRILSKLSVPTQAAGEHLGVPRDRLALTQRPPRLCGVSQEDSRTTGVIDDTRSAREPMTAYLHQLVLQHRATAAMFIAERDQRSQRPFGQSTTAAGPYPIVHADPEPTAHPSREAWPSARRTGSPDAERPVGDPK